MLIVHCIMTGIWPDEHFDGDDYQRPLPISVKLAHRIREPRFYYDWRMCSPDGTVIVDLDRNVFCALDGYSFDKYACENEGCYFYFCPFDTAVSIGEMVDNSLTITPNIKTNKELLDVEQKLYSKKFDHIFKFSFNKDEESITLNGISCIIDEANETYIDLWDRYCVSLELNNGNQPANDNSNDNSGQTNQQSLTDLSEPPKKRQRLT